MKNKFLILIIATILNSVAFNLLAQEDQDDKDYRKNKDKNAINTKKKTPVKITEFIVGSWTIKKIFKGNKEIYRPDSLVIHETIEFDYEGRYARYVENEKIDSGAYRVNEDQALLSLESINDITPSEWRVSFTKGTMSLRKKDDSEHAESFKYVYSRNIGLKDKESN